MSGIVECVMKIEDLSNDEIDHELFIRGIKGLVTRREKTSNLRKAVVSESRNGVDPPGFPTGLLDVTIEFETCENKILELNNLLDRSYVDRDEFGFLVTVSRLVHLYNRLNRLVGSYKSNKSFKEARDCVQRTLVRIQKANFTKGAAAVEVVNDFNVEGSPDELDKSVHSRISIEQHSVRATNASVGINKDPVSSDRGGAVRKSMSAGKIAGKVDQLAKSFQSLLNLQPKSSANTTELANSKTPVKNYRSKPKRVESSINPFIDDCDDLLVHDLSEILPPVRPLQPSGGRARLSAGYAPQRERGMSRDRFDVQEEVVYNARSGVGGKSGKDGYLYTERDNFDSDERLRRQEPLRQTTRYQDLGVPREPSRFRYQEPRADPYREQVPRYRDELYDREQYVLDGQRRRFEVENREQRDYAWNNIRYEPRAQFEQREPMRNRVMDPRDDYLDHNMYRDRGGNRDNGVGGRRFKKTIPINQWNIKFSGDDSGLSLSEFLGEVELFAESEQFSPCELFSSAVHLFSGFARKWFKANYSQLFSWEELVRALKQEFQPEYYDYLLLAEIDSRLQGKEENFASFYSEMVILFGKLNTPLSEQHKLFLLKKNMVKTYAMAIATMDIVSVRQLSVVCKRLDSTRRIQDQQQHISVSNSGRFVEPAYRTPVSQYYKKPFRPQVNAVEEANGDSDEEVCEFRRNPQKPRYNNAPRVENNHMDLSQYPCFNCNKSGHFWRECPSERGRFCFVCGLKDVTILSCPRCRVNQSKEPTVS